MSDSQEKGTISLMVITFNEKKPVEVQKNATISDFKEVVAKHFNAQSSELVLIFAGKIMENQNTLATYNVEDGFAVHLVIKNASASQNNSMTTPSTNTRSAPIGGSPGLLGLSGTELMDSAYNTEFQLSIDDAGIPRLWRSFFDYVMSIDEQFGQNALVTFDSIESGGDRDNSFEDKQHYDKPSNGGQENKNAVLISGGKVITPAHFEFPLDTQMLNNEARRLLLRELEEMLFMPEPHLLPQNRAVNTMRQYPVVWQPIFTGWMPYFICIFMFIIFAFIDLFTF